MSNVTNEARAPYAPVSVLSSVESAMCAASVGGISGDVAAAARTQHHRRDDRTSPRKRHRENGPRSRRSSRTLAGHSWASFDDDPQNVARRRLLLQRLGHLRMSLCERSVLLLQFGEQADVLDGDDRLGGEGLQELDLPVSERPYLGPPDADRPDGLGPAEQRNAERCPETEGSRKETGLRVFVDLGLHIGNMDRPPLEYRTSHGRSTYQGERAHRMREDRPFVSDETEPVTVNLEDRGIQGVAQTGGAPQHCREHGLDVGRRAGDHAEDLGRRRLLLPRLRLALQRFRQALLKVADPRAFVLRRLPGNRARGFGFVFAGFAPRRIGPSFTARWSAPGYAKAFVGASTSGLCSMIQASVPASWVG